MAHPSWSYVQVPCTYVSIAQSNVESPKFFVLSFILRRYWFFCIIQGHVRMLLSHILALSVT